MTEQCSCDYPVSLTRARRAFARARKQLDAAVEAHGDFLEEDSRIRAERCYSLYGGYFSPLNHYLRLLDERARFAALDAFAKRVLKLRLTRQEICQMEVAEREDFTAKWAATVERQKATPYPPEKPKEEPKPEPRPHPWLIQEPPPKRVGIWARLFGFE